MPTYLAAQAQVDKAKRDLTRTTVLAPIPGIVTNVDALQVGEYLPAAQPPSAWSPRPMCGSRPTRRNPISPI